MNKFNAVLIGLLSLILISSFVLAELNSDDLSESEDLDIKEDAELEEAEEKTIPLEELKDERILSNGRIKPYIRTLFFSGTGIASSPVDALDFYTVKVAGGKVVLSDGNIIGRGTLVLDDQKFRLVDLVIEGDHARAKIFSVNADNSTSDLSEVGNLDLTKVAKPSVDVWAGKMVFKEKNYNFYLINHKREFKAEEVAEKARNYCRDHPYDEKCKSVAGYLCKENNEECRLKVYKYCQDHKDDARCKELTLRYCAGNLKDARCRELNESYCNENPDSSYCNHEAVDFCKENPDNERCRNVFAEYCKEHSNELRCNAEELAFCRKNPLNEKCVPILKQYCEFNQKALVCADLKIDYCKENPDTLRCKATATALCTLPEYKDSEKCTQIISQAKERVREAVRNAEQIANKINSQVNSGD